MAVPTCWWVHKDPMKFINSGSPKKIRVGTAVDCYWITLKTGETIDLPKKRGKALGLTKVKTTEGQLGDNVVETKQVEIPKQKEEQVLDGKFRKELQSINGIGKKTAKDIAAFGTKKRLIIELKAKAHLPFRDDVVKLLEKEYA